jgi:excisionase family DNA binding protein
MDRAQKINASGGHYPVAILRCGYNNTSMMTAEYTTAQVAKACGVGKMFLLRLVWSGKLPEARVAQLGGMKFRFWSEEDLARAVELVARPRAGKGMKGKVPAGLAHGSQD